MIKGTETVDGVECLVIETKDGEEISTAYIGTSDGLVRKAVTGKETMLFKYSRVNAVPDSDFEVPKGMKVRDMTKMMQGMKALGGMFKGAGN